MVNINIRFKKKDLFLVLAIGIFVIGIGFVIAFGDYAGNEAQINGHSSDEIMVKNSSGNLITLQQFVNQSGGGSSSFGNYGSTINRTDISTETEEDEISATRATTDLLVFGVVQPSVSSGWTRYGFKGYTSPTFGGTYVLRAAMSAQDDTNGGGAPWSVQSFVMFVKKGEYYKITKQGLWGAADSLTRTYTTIPIGN
jgi:hypothetical protein